VDNLLETSAPFSLFVRPNEAVKPSGTSEQPATKVSLSSVDELWASYKYQTPMPGGTNPPAIQ
jgi:hypothetical protein